MNLKELLKSINYKTTFNYIYKIYYKDKHFEDYKIMEKDASYRKALEELKSLEFEFKEENKDLRIYILKIQDEDEQGDRVDVCLYDELNDSIFSIDFVPWNQLIELDIQDGINANKEELAAHILWELTFWGFTSQEVEKQAEITLQSVDEPLQPFNT